jgi:predicted SnoaL-like aldol condensation-catalyzing enzyme
MQMAGSQRMHFVGKVFIALASLAIPAVALAETAQEQKNKQVAIDFYNAALNEKNWPKAEAFIGKRFVQHSIYAPDGSRSVKELVEMLRKEHPDNHGEIKAAWADGDLVAMHVHVKRNATHRGWAVVELMRIENNKVVEHWDMFQPVPETAQNDNTMF